MLVKIIKKLRTNPIEWAHSATSEELSLALKEASRVYYNSNSVLISDEEFDSIIEIYNSKSLIPYSAIGAQIDDMLENKVKLPVHMGSMNKTKSPNEIVKWLNIDSNEFDSVIISPKIDGTSALISIKLNDLTNLLDIEIFTRGDGEYGKKIDFIAPIIITKKISENIINYFNAEQKNKLLLRGELIISNKNFAPFNKEFKCPRSMVNGITNTKLEMSNLNIVEFLCFELISPSLKTIEQFNLIRELGFSMVNTVVINTDNLKETSLSIKDASLSIPEKYLINWRNTYDYEIDGIILTKNKLNTLPQSGNPKYSLAFKINKTAQKTRVEKIIWNVSKHGVLKPTVVFNKIVLGTSEVVKSTGFNAAFIFKNSLGPGAVIGVVLSGEVIPYIVEVIEQASIPQMPECNYKWNDSKIDILLVGDSDEFEKKKIVNFIKVVGIDNISVGLIANLFNHGYKTLKSILLITYEDLIKIDRIEHTLAIKIRGNINKVINEGILLSKLMDASLCFNNGFGYKRCEQIVNKFPLFLDNIPSSADLLLLDGWSDKSVSKFYNGLNDFRSFLEEHDYIKIKQFSKDLSDTITNKLPFSKVCLTGKRDKIIIEFLKTHGVDISNTVTNNVELLICDDKNGNSSKIKTAEEKGITIVEATEFKTNYSL